MSFKNYRNYNKVSGKETENKENVENNENTNANENLNVDENVNENENVNVDENNNNEKQEETIVTTKGVVTATKLNVRRKANKNADVLTVISKGTGVGINLTKSTDNFYCVNTIVNGEMATGYCMKEFIAVK